VRSAQQAPQLQQTRGLAGQLAQDIRLLGRDLARVIRMEAAQRVTVRG
jgi:hypothetical protein